MGVRLLPRWAGLVISLLGLASLALLQTVTAAVQPKLPEPVPPLLDDSTIGISCAPGNGLFQWSPSQNMLLYRELGSGPSGPGGISYRLWLRNVDTGEARLITDSAVVHRPRFTSDGKGIQYWKDDLPYQMSLQQNSPSPVVTDATSRKGDLSPDGRLLFYVTSEGEARIHFIESGQEKSLGANVDLAQLGPLWPEWSPDSQQIAFVANEIVYVLPADAGSLEEATAVSAMSAPQGEFSPDLRLLQWSDLGAVVTANPVLNSVIEHGDSTPNGLGGSWSFDGAFHVTCADGELVLHNASDGEIEQLTHNRATVLANQPIQRGSAASTLTVSEVADGFDYPVAKPNGAGYNTTIGCWWLQRDQTGLCAPGPHPAQDFNKDGAALGDYREPVYAVAHGTVVDSGYYTPKWGNIILIEHTLPDGSKIWSQYAHLDELNVNNGAEVRKGETIGTIGKGAAEYSPHLHFEMRIKWLDASFWPSGWTDSQVREYYTKPTDFIDSHRSIGPVGPDTTPPTGEITAPTEGATVTSRSVLLSGRAWDSSSRLARTRFLVTYNGIQRPIPPDDEGYFLGSPFDYWWDMCEDDVPNGQQISLTIEAWDEADNWTVTAGGTRHFYKSYNCGSSSDTTPPAGGINTPSEGASIGSRTVYLSGWAADSGSGFSRAHFLATFNGIQRQIGPDFTGSPFGFTWDMCADDASDGQISLTLEAWDQAGNKATAPGGTRRFTKNYSCPDPPPSPGTCNPSADGVHLFRDEDHGGECQSFTSDIADLTGSRIGNNQASSIKIVGPYEAWLYKSQNYQEGESHFLESDNDLADEACGDNNVSSIKVRKSVCDPGSKGVTLYREKDFKGTCETFTGSDSDLTNNLIGNNQASSLTVVGDYEACLYRSQNFAEGESCFTRDDSDLSNNSVSENNASSIRINPLTCYTLTTGANPTSGGSVSVSPSPNCGSRYRSGTVVQVTAIPASGYNFANWSGGASGTANPVAVTMSGDKVVTANFPPIPVCYSLSTSVNPGGVGSVVLNPAPNCAGGTKYVAGTVVQLTANASSGYSFANWSGGASGTANPVAVTMNGDKSVTANFSATPPSCYALSILVNPGGGGNVTPSPAPNCAGETMYVAGTVVQLTANASSGYSFASWSGGASGAANPVAVTMNGDKSVTANFSAAPPSCYALNILVNPGGGGNVTSSPAPNCSGGTMYTTGTVVQLTANASGGYSFANWSGAVSGSANPVAVTMNGDKSVTANFSATPPSCYALSILVSPPGGGNVTPNPAPNCSGGKYVAGTVVQLTANASSGYSFANWSGGASGAANPVAVTMNGDKSVMANFSATPPSCYTLSILVNPGGGGNVTPSPAPNCSGGTKYVAGTVVQLTANASSGYSFASWSGGASGAANPVAVNMNGDKSVTANFSAAPPSCYALSILVNPAGGGNVTPSPAPNCSGGTKYVAGTVVQLTANASSGYSFANWSGAVSGSTNPVAVTMNGDKSVTANFIQRPNIRKVHLPLIRGN